MRRRRLVSTQGRPPRRRRDHARAQGRGLGKSVTGAALTALIRDYGTAALMVEADNTAAQSLYHSLGMTYRPVRAAFTTGQDGGLC